MEQQYTAVYQRHGRWYVAYVEEIPGVNTQGRTLKEARENLQEALELVLDANRELLAQEQGDAPVKRESITVRTSSGQ
jgi:predicted RNase H-like HicB family nuclease